VVFFLFFLNRNEGYFYLCIMRLVKEIPHSHYLVQVHEYNGKYLLKITLDHYEQLFKIPVSDLPDLALLEAKLTQEFWSSCLQRFFSMREDASKFLH
jgi:hypothetical protein